jgi:hypothetical protein
VNDFKLCFSCHNEVAMLGVPENYGLLFSEPPPFLSLPAGVAQTNYRNEYQWGFAWDWYGGMPANIHWNHVGVDTMDWNIDHDSFMNDSRRSCVTCHNPHGELGFDDQPTLARTMADLAIGHGVYNDGTTDREYRYIGSGEWMQVGGDLHCRTCHPWFGPGNDPPNTGTHTRYYREPLNLHDAECLMCHTEWTRSSGVLISDTETGKSTGTAIPATRVPACTAGTRGDSDGDCRDCHSMETHRKRRAGR